MITALPAGINAGIHCTGGWLALGPVWTGVEVVESLGCTGIQTANHTTHSVSLYRTRYPDFCLSCRIPFSVDTSFCCVNYKNSVLTVFLHARRTGKRCKLIAFLFCNKIESQNLVIAKTNLNVNILKTKLLVSDSVRTSQRTVFYYRK